MPIGEAVSVVDMVDSGGMRREKETRPLRKFTGREWESEVGDPEKRGRRLSFAGCCFPLNLLSFSGVQLLALPIWA